MATATQSAPQQAAPIGLERIATLVHLERRARSAQSLAELGFVIVNETLGLMQYRQAVLMGRARGGREMLMVSGVAEPSADAPFTVWIRAVLRSLGIGYEEKCRTIRAIDLTEGLAAEWSTWLPAVLVLVPLRQGTLEFGLVAFAREEAPSEGELRILGMVAESYAYSWSYLAHGKRLKPRELQPVHRRWLWLGVAAAVVAVSFVPVRSAVLATAEVIPLQPAVVRSALDGVVDRILVAPNQMVAEGQVLVQLDARRIRSQLESARLAAIATEAELRQTRQSSVADPRVRTLVPALQGRFDQLEAEVRFLESQDERLEVRAPRAGVAVFDNAHEWLGRPVSIGERIMQIADPAAVELEIRLPVADAIQLTEGAEVLFFRNVDPHRPIQAALSFIGYRATSGPDGIVAYRLKASFTHGLEGAPRIGLKGTAKVYGEPVAIGYYLLRRPLAAARVALGL